MGCGKYGRARKTTKNKAHRRAMKGKHVAK